MKYAVQLTRTEDIVSIKDTKEEAYIIAIDYLKNEYGEPYVNSGISWYLTNMPNQYTEAEQCYGPFVEQETAVKILNVID